MVRAFRLPVAVHVAVVASALCASAQDARLRVNTFPGPQNLALFVAQDKGLFAKRGLSVEISFTPNSQAQRDGLVKGTFEIAQAGVDNAVALVDAAKQDVVIVSGGSNGMNELIVRPQVKSYDDIRGKTVVVDAPNTAYAFLLYKMLALKGVTKGDYAVLPAGGCTQRLDAMREDTTRVAAMMNPPCNLIAAKEGYHSFGLATDVIGSYQADGAWVMRAWANGNSATLTKYLEAVIEGYRRGSNPLSPSISSSILKLPKNRSRRRWEHPAALPRMHASTWKGSRPRSGCVRRWRVARQILHRRNTWISRTTSARYRNFIRVPPPSSPAKASDPVIAARNG
jgi:ABC-type nitrate/sulfonate/bicarbonate transport system substrate-binding protein